MDVLDENFNSKKLFSNQNTDTNETYLNSNSSSRSLPIGSPPLLKYHVDEPSSVSLSTDMMPRNENTSSLDASLSPPPPKSSPDGASNRSSNSNASLNSNTAAKSPATAVNNGAGQARSQFTISDNESDRNSSSLETSFEMSTEIPAAVSSGPRKSTLDSQSVGKMAAASLSRAGSSSKLPVGKETTGGGSGKTTTTQQLSLSNYSATSFDNTNGELANTPQSSAKLLADMASSPLSRTTQMIVETASSATNAFTDVVSNLMSSNSAATAVNSPPDQYSFNNTGDFNAPSQTSAMTFPDLDSTSGRDDSKASGSKQKTPRKTNSSAGMVVKAKKPWYSAFTNSYKQKNEDFKKQFKLPSDEHLLVDYSCALQREILAHGRLYISLNYVCFHANIIGWETTLAIRLKDIKNILKDKTARIIPNAITVVLDYEKYFFTSFASRDKTYMTLLKVWHIASSNMSMSQKEISDILKNSYGDDLGYNSDDPEYEYMSQLKSAGADMDTSNNDDFYRNIRPASANVFDNLFPVDSSGATDASLNGTDSSIKSPPPPTNGKAIVMNSTPSSHGGGNVSGHRHASSFDTSKIMIQDDSAVQTSERPKSVMIKRRSVEINNDSSNVSNTSDDSTGSVQMPQSTLYDENRSATTTARRDQSTRSGGGGAESSTANDGADYSSDARLVPNDVQLVDEPEITENVKCTCDKHEGKSMFDETYPLSVNYLWECLFGHTEACRKYWESRKFQNMKLSEWKTNPSTQLPSRQLEFTVDLGPIGRPKNTEDQRVIYYKSNHCIVLESESVTHGVIYCDYFTVKNRFCITRCTNKRSRLQITSFINYTQKPNFIAKTFIERNTMGALKDSYNYLASKLQSEYNSADKLCHEPAIASCILDFQDEISFQTHRRSCSSGGSYIRRNNDDYEEANLPKQVEPAYRTSEITAFPSSKASLLPKGQAAQSPANTQAPVAGTDQSLASSSSQNNKSKKSSSSTATITTAETRRYREQADDVDGVHRRATASSQLLSQDMDGGRIGSTISQSHQGNHSSAQNNQPQLVPIQRFSFFKWEINVDTLVRLFIIAMICLMVINAMLYYKLRRIETLADGIRSDPSLASRLTAPVHLTRPIEPPEQIPNPLGNRNNFQQDLTSWRDVISNTLTVIQKMENSLKEWDKTLEKRQEPGGEL